MDLLRGGEVVASVARVAAAASNRRLLLRLLFPQQSAVDLHAEAGDEEVPLRCT